MAKMVEISFAIGATLAGSFNGTFSQASQALSNLSKQTNSLQKASGQIDAYKKMQEKISENQTAMVKAREQAKMFETQIASSKQKTAELSSQFRDSQAKINEFSAALVRNKDAHKAAQLNVQNLENQIKNSTGSTSELQKQYALAQAEARRLGDSVKQSSASLKAEQNTAQRLKAELNNSKNATKLLSNEAQGLNRNAAQLQNGLDRDRESLAKLQSELKKAGVDTKNLASEQARLANQSQKVAQAQTNLQNSRARLAQTRQNLSWNNIQGELLTAVGLGYSLYKPVSEAADFEQAMARVNAVAFSGGGRDKEADTKAFQALQEQARQLGRDTQFTAVQAAQSQENLARAGFNSNEIISAMPGLLNMAAAEGMDLANAADIAASTLRGFNLNADQSNRVADVLAQASAASNTNIAMLGESLKMCAPSAAGLGVSIEQVTAMLGVMANNGIKGTESGTALRNMFLRLSQEPGEVEKALKKLGIASRDAQGNMRELPELMLVLYEKIKKYGKADQTKYLADIFGARAVTGAMAVMNGAVDGSLQNLEWLEKECNGIMTAILEHINKGSKEAVISIEEMRAGMQNSGAYAGKLGVSYKDLSISLALLARSGIKGEQADKGLTAAFKQLAEQPKKVQAALKQFNISAYTKDGHLKEFPALMGEIKQSVMGISDQTQRLNLIESIFGKGSGAVVQALLKTMTEETLEAYNKVADSAVGVSQEMREKVENTMRGAWRSAGSAVSDLMISIGNVLLPTVTDLVKSFGEFTRWIGKLAEENPAWTEAIVGTVGALAALRVGMFGMKVGWNLVRMPFDMAKVAMDTFHARSLVAAQDMAENTKKAGLFSRAGKGLANGAKAIGRGFMFIGKGIGTFFKNMFSMGKNLVNGLFSPMGAKILIIAGIIAAVAAAAYLIYKNWDKIKEWWNSWTLKDVFAVVKEYVDRAWQAVKNLWQKFKDWWDSWTLADIFAIVKEYAINAYNWVKNKWDEFLAWWDNSILKDIFAIVKEYATKAYNLVKNKWNEFWAWWNSWSLGDIFAPVVEFAKNCIDGIKGLWQDFKNWIYGLFANLNPFNWELPAWLGGKDTPSSENLEEQIQDITVLNKMSEGFSQRVAEMTAAWQPFKATLGEGFSEIYSIMQNIAEKIRGVTIPAINELASALSKVATEINSIVQSGDLKVKVEKSKSVQDFTPSYMKGYATGGFINYPQIALIGEAGREAVIPLEDKTRGIPLWQAAGEELGLLGTSTINNDNHSKSISFSPNVSITVNGGEQGIEQRFRQIVEDVLGNLRNDLERLSFA